MRLDHLLSKENRVFCFVTVWVLVSTWLVTEFLFSGEDRYRTYFVCVVLGVDETRTFCGLSALIGCKGFCRVTSVFVFGFVLFCGMLLGV